VSKDVPQHIFNVTYDDSVPFHISDSIENVLNILESVFISDLPLSFIVNMSSGGDQWGSSDSSFWTSQYQQFITSILQPNVSAIFPNFGNLQNNIDWPRGWGWSGGQILLTNWQAYARGAITDAQSLFTLWIDDDFMDRFDFNSTDGTDSDKFDFETIILHQMLHELGFHSVVDWLNVNFTQPQDADFWIFPFDVFRFSYPTPSDAQNVLTDPREFDPSHIPHSFWDGSLTVPVELERGVNYTGYNASHWLHLDNAPLWGIMDANIPEGKAVGLSLNDVASLRAMGWTVKDNIPPQLTSAKLNGSSILAHGNLVFGPALKCRLNQNYVVDPSTLAPEQNYKWVTCPIPQPLSSQDGPFFLELSNDGGNTWSNQVRAVNNTETHDDDDSSPAAHLSSLFSLVVAIFVGFMF